jgi:hypothetical protein
MYRSHGLRGDTAVDAWRTGLLKSRRKLLRLYRLHSQAGAWER